MAMIFVVEDNENLREAVTSFLKLEDFTVREFGVVQNVYESIGELTPDLIILDVMLPDGDGFLLAQKIRKTYVTPIIFLTARDSESSRITGFEIGCDDYIVKPFSTRELVLRVKALLKRTGTKPATKSNDNWIYENQTLVLKRESHQILINGDDVSLTATEWKILDFLISSAGILIDRQRLLSTCLDYNFEMSERTIITHIKNLRSKLGNPGWIETVRGFGYRFRGTESD